MDAPRKLLIASVAGLGHEFLSRHAAELRADSPLRAHRCLRPPFPAVTCTAQATFRTAVPPAVHGMVANGLYDRRWRKVLFWEQAASLVEGPRIWSAFRARGKTVGLLFWQQAMGEDADFALTPAPIHKHHGGMVLDCYSQPSELYPRLRRRLGEFALHRYWGPLASAKVGDWVAAATADVMRQEGPDLLLTYLPTLDYDLQRFGPDDPRSVRALRTLDAQVATLAAAARDSGYEFLFWGDYAIAGCAGPAVLPNRALREAGLFAVRDVRGHLYPDFHRSRAVAVCDHEVAHVYVREARDRDAARACLAALPGVGRVEAGCADAVRAAGRNAGDLVLLASPGRWCAYPWWDADREAPDYARHIDIHNKPGFDPCELVASWLPPGITLDTRRIRGTHGRDDRPAAWGGTLALEQPVATLQDLAAAVRDWLADVR